MALAVMPAIILLLSSVIWMVVGITRSVEPPPFSSPVGEMAATWPVTVSPFKISAEITASCPTWICPMEYSLTLTFISRFSKFSIINMGLSSSILSAKRPTLALTLTTVPEIGAVTSVSFNCSLFFSSSNSAFFIWSI